MNVLGIGGSPRIDGNSNSLLRLALEGARERGAAAEIVYASRLDVQGCDACDGCKDTMDVSCVVEDDMQDLYELLASCDVLVLATPVYFYQMTSWLKTVVDRLYGLLGPEYEPRIAGGKGFYVITTEEEERTYTGQEIAGMLMRASGLVQDGAPR